MGIYLDISCLACGSTAQIGDDQIDKPEYKCPCCGMSMAKSQWRRAKVNFFVAEELLRQAAAALGDESSAVEIRAFDYVCRGPSGLPIRFNTSMEVTANDEN